MKKFKLRQAVYMVESCYKRSRRKCTTCAGKGEFTIVETGAKVDCWKCHGKGKISTQTPSMRPRKDVITGVRVTTVATCGKPVEALEYMLRGNSWWLAGRHLHATKAEAQDVADKYMAEQVARAEKLQVALQGYAQSA